MSQTSAQLHALTKDKLVELALKQGRDNAKIQKKLDALLEGQKNQPVATGGYIMPPHQVPSSQGKKAPCPSLVAACIGGVLDPMSKTPMDDGNFQAEAPLFVNQAITLAEMIQTRLDALYPCCDADDGECCDDELDGEGTGDTIDDEEGNEEETE